MLFTTTIFANVSLMPLSDLKPGMKGYGKTVIQGDKIETFDVEILGVNGSQVMGETIFVRLSGDLIKKTGGVLQGMSGSPVYIDGRLAGAIAFGRAFDDPHYCFLTPIGQMLDLVDEVHYPSNWLPKGSVLSAGGFTDEGFAHLKERLGNYELQAVPGGTQNYISGDFEPGASVGVSLVNGDLTLGALGTVTWMDDTGNLLAFGHQFLKRGTANFFLNKVWILGTVANLQSGYKIGQIGQIAGSICQDRAAGVAGVLGQEPKSIPLVVNVGDFDRGVRQTVRVKLAEDEILLPELVDSVVYNTLTKVVDRGGGGTAQLKFSIDATGKKQENGEKTKERYEIRRENMYFATTKLLNNLDGEMINSLSDLSLNKFNKLNIEKIAVDVKVSEDLRVAEVKEISVPRRIYYGGDTINVKVKLKPYRGEDFERIVDFKIPEKHKGKLTICVRGGSSLLWLERLLKKNQDEQMPLQSKEAREVLKDYVEHLNSRDKNNELIIDVGGKNLSQVAKKNEAGLMGLLKGTPAKVKQEYDFIVMGEMELSFDVK
ncbi:MAG: hypothetical protein MJ032_01085 [Acidaminococcaceae bacterium]|nr:hypothetical protein [Acidaminococcaceae bacterium]